MLRKWRNVHPKLEENIRISNSSKLWKLIGFVIGLATLACTPEEEMITGSGEAMLSFGQDTVLFDTLFTTQKSITKGLKIYNPENRAVETNIQLAGGLSSSYTLYINGEKGVNFENVLLRGKDSLMVLVEAYINPQDENLPFLVEDSLLFRTNGNEQKVKLISWGQDAFFIKAWHIQHDTVLSAARPYVITDSIWVQENVRLEIPEGANLYFGKGSSLWIDGSLHVNGSKEQPILFTHVRQDGAYANGPGQWQGILMSEKSNTHRIDHAIIRNAEVGLFIIKTDEDTIPDLHLSNTVIENMSVNGILSVGSDTDAYNLLVSHCIVNAVGNIGKGYYRYVHCTFANDALTYARQGPTLYFSDTPEPLSNQPFQLILQNNIVWGSMNDELIISAPEAGAVIDIKANLIKAESFPYAATNIFNEDPRFTDPAIYVYTLDSTSPAINKGISTFVKKDLASNDRDLRPDLGAYEYVKEKEE
ncbi:hypothetical protein [Catalinimonas niigatensis]|uniref:hypothetical protein n=1 Tax=Catalinimonas niigatensis TaxID=1397264 RepID=UPI002665F3D5|nr:hypothetical protein [Catalinimonas niigatensis]WPP53628.1 hypothetical protein PZB72_14750 [Catalinimonas niigatensis]